MASRPATILSAPQAPQPSGPDANFAKNKPYAVIKPSYQTTLSKPDEQQFQAWVAKNKVPFDPSPKADYDMRGFWLALQQHKAIATTAINENDGMMHYPDRWKTPYHQSFSNESQWAKPGAPKWNENDQLVLPNGRVVFDEKANAAREAQQ